MWWAPIAASVGGSLINKVLGSGEQKTEETRDLKKMVKDAKDAGFNPLTVLNATGGQGWGAQVSSTDLDFGTMAAGAALQGIGDYWAQQQNRELMDAQIDLAKAQAASLTGAAQVGPFGSAVRTVQSAGRSGGIAETAPRTWPVGATTTYSGKAQTAFGFPLDTDAVVDESDKFRTKEEGSKNAYSYLGLPDWWPTGETIETIFGDSEIVSTLYGVATLPIAAGETGRRLGKARNQGGAQFEQHISDFWNENMEWPYPTTPEEKKRPWKWRIGNDNWGIGVRQ